MMSRIKPALPSRIKIVCNGVKLGTKTVFIKSVTTGARVSKAKIELAHAQANAIAELDKLISSGTNLKQIKGQDLAKFQAAAAPAAKAKTPAVLSKTSFVTGLQCLKQLWVKYNDKSRIPAFSPAVQARLNEGIGVGKLAQKLFPNGIELERDLDPKVTDQRATEALKKRVPLFEAGFTKDRVYALVDILDIEDMGILSGIAPVEGATDLWDLVEVKATTKVKDVHLEDVSFQRHVYEKRGVKIRKCFLMHLNPEYARKGELDLNQLFMKEDITAEVDKLMPEVPGKAAAMLKAIDGKEPKIGIGQHCNKPYECALQEICWKAVLPSENHVLMLYRAGKKVYEELLNNGIVKMSDIPKDFKLSATQQIQVRAHKTGKPHVNKNAIREFLSKLVYPIHLLDFETLASAVPIYDGSRPYEEIPFQFSLHVIEKPGAEPVHYSFLAPGKDHKTGQLIDPRPEILRILKEKLGSSGSIVAYNAPYEVRCSTHMVRAYPDYAEWFNSLFPADAEWKDGFAGRFVDLLVPFRNFDYYNPKQNGSASMKHVLPALIGGNTYEEMKAAGGIGEGETARREYMRVTFGDNITEEDLQHVRDALLKYCGEDTDNEKKFILALEALYK